MELKIKCKNGQEYYIDEVTSNISKLNRKGEKQPLTYNDMSKMYLDFTAIKLSDEDLNTVKKYLLDHQFLTIWFSNFNKEKFPDDFTLEQVVDKLMKKPSKLLSTYATSILFLQSENLNYKTLLSSPDTLPEYVKQKVDTYNSLFIEFGMNTYNTFPHQTYQEFLECNQAVSRNSTSVEQTLKLIGINPDKSDAVYAKTSNIWNSYLLGKNSQLSFKEAFPILNLTCTYSLYKINFKDKEFENLLSKFVKAQAEKDTSDRNYSNFSTEFVLSNPSGRTLFNKVLTEKVKCNNSIQARPHIADYLLKQFNYDNFINYPDQENQKMVKWLMKFENSSNENVYQIEVSEIIKHNVTHAQLKVLEMAKKYNKTFGVNIPLPQELQPFGKVVLAENKQTPKIYEQVKQILSTPTVSLTEKENIVKFFNILNKAAIKDFKENNKDSKQINLSEIYSKYFAQFSKYAMSSYNNLKEVSEMFVDLISKKDKLPAWIFKEASEVAEKDQSNNRSSRDDTYNSLKDNLSQISQIDDFLKKTDIEIYKEIYRNNYNCSNIYEYKQQLFDLNKKPKDLEYNPELDYNIFKFIKEIKIDRRDPNAQEKFEIEFGKFLCNYTGLTHNLKKLREIRTIKNIKAEELGSLASQVNSFKTNLNTLIEDKYQEKETIETYLAQLKTNLTGEKLQEYMVKNPIVLNHLNQVVYEDENYTCFIPSFDDVCDWAEKMHNCMRNCYLPAYKKGRGLFLYLCKKGQFGTPLNATYLGDSWGGNSNYVRKTINDNLKYNKSTKDPKSPNYKKPEKKPFAGLECTQCYSNGRSMYGQPRIFELETHDHKYKLQTVEEREQLHKFCKELIKRTGFDGSSWFQEFDEVMARYYAEKKAKNKVAR